MVQLKFPLEKWLGDPEEVGEEDAEEEGGGGGGGWATLKMPETMLMTPSGFQLPGYWESMENFPM